MYICVMMLLLFRFIDSEHNFMDRYSQDHLVSSVRNVSIRTYTCMMFVHVLEVENVLGTDLNHTYMHAFIGNIHNT